MSYTLQEQYTSKNYTPAVGVPATFGMPRNVTSITIHHWGLKGQFFDTVRDFLCTNNTPTSAHYVAQDGLVACIVNPDDAAWHSGNAEGNATSIGIECRPEATDGDYATTAELIANIRAIYGDIPLHPHNFWFNTACPGDYDLSRLDSLARRSSTIAAQGTITPVQEDDMAAVPQAEWDAMKLQVASLVDNVATKKHLDEQAARTPAQVWSYQNPNIGGGDAFQILRNIPASVLNQTFKLPDGTVTNLSGILSAIHAVPATGGTVTTVTPQAIVDAIVNGIQITKK